MEWNSKDQTFDRDLYAARTFYECGIVDAGVLLTRSKALGPVFAENRLDAGRGGGCPVLAIGIKPAVIEDFEEWKEAHPVIRQQIDVNELIEGDEDGDDSDEG